MTREDDAQSGEPSASGQDREGPAVTRRPDDPGAHSGAESEAQDRIVPGTASAAEGYAHTGEGTAAAAPLEGIEKAPDGDQDTSDPAGPAGE
jgi:hypothetical protein